MLASPLLISKPLMCQFHNGALVATATAERFILTDRGADGGDVIGLQVIDDVLDGLDALLDGEVHLVVLAADVSRHLRVANVTLVPAKSKRRGEEPTFRAANTSGLLSVPMEKVWRGYCSFSSLASFMRVAETRLESSPPEDHQHPVSRKAGTAARASMG